jgi:hypothetical protein
MFDNLLGPDHHIDFHGATLHVPKVEVLADLGHPGIFNPTAVLNQPGCHLHNLLAFSGQGLDGRAVKLWFSVAKVDDSHGILFDGWVAKDFMKEVGKGSHIFFLTTLLFCLFGRIICPRPVTASAVILLCFYLW